MKYIDANLSGKHSASRLLYPQIRDAISSSYPRGKQQDVRNIGGARPEKPKAKPNGYASTAAMLVTARYHCRTSDAPSAPRMVKCQKCGRQNHIDKACLRGRSTKTPFEEIN